jgi:S1-C subfamily serine protease
VVTNFHVVEGCHSAEIVVNNFIFDEVALVKTIPKFDIAILKIDGFGLPEISFGDSDLVRPGEVIVSIGNPLGLDRSVSEGVVSAIREENNIKIIQMTAPVSLGSSGGPIFNEYGQVVGITTLATTFGAQNLNFAIPINYLKFALDTK